MAHPLYVAFVWHQHQPLYKSRGTLSEGVLKDLPVGDVPSEGAYRLPWVRLHGTKDYLDLAQILSHYPKLHQTFNLVPSLILQIEDYVANRAMDPYLAAALTPVEQLQPKDYEFIVDHFFDGNHHTLVDPHPRYRELYEQRQDKGRSWCLEHWRGEEWGDLLAWHNLAWIDPLFWDDPEIAGWLKRDRGFTLADRQAIWEKQRQIMARILPQHRQMQEAGQIEITTTPYTHPILPLLMDTDAGRVAVPGMELPETRFQYGADVPRHLRKAKEVYRDRFGCEPKGLWPSEQSVSPAILPDVAAAGFQWLISDEAVLGWTLGHFFHRDASGNVLEPELLYRPYRLETEAGELAIVFRDHRLSDLIGFTYGAMDPRQAATDLVGHLEAIARSLKYRQPEGGTTLNEPRLVTIALDGENCWEYYAQDGKPFLEALYGTLSAIDDIQLVTVGEFVEKFPPIETLPADKLHSGSWVDGSFTTWIGDPAKNRAWDLLKAARDTMAAHPEATEETNPAAWEALYAAEGSDWFWWFGFGHSSNQDALFDRLFREHLCAIYQALGEPVPEPLLGPIEVHEALGDRRPQSFIHPIIDGRGDEQDWDRAGCIDVGGARGTMHQASPVQRIWYGVDHLNFYLRIDFQTGAEPGKTCPRDLNLVWYYPNRPGITSPAPFAAVPDFAPANYRFRNHLGIDLVTDYVWAQEAIADHCWHSRPTRAQAKRDRCLEVAVPWADLPAEPDWDLHLIVILSDRGQYCDVLPLGSTIAIGMP